MQPGATRIVLLLTGMRNNECREEIAAALRRVTAVKDVSVSLIRASAVIVCDPACNATDLIKAVEAAGFGAAIDKA